MGKSLTLDDILELEKKEKYNAFLKSIGTERHSYFEMAIKDLLGTTIRIVKNNILDFRNPRPSGIRRVKIAIAKAKMVIHLHYFDHIRISPENSRFEVIRGVFFIEKDGRLALNKGYLLDTRYTTADEKVGHYLERINPVMRMRIQNRSNPGAVWKQVDAGNLFPDRGLDYSDVPVNYLYLENAMNHYEAVSGISEYLDICKHLKLS